MRLLVKTMLTSILQSWTQTKRRATPKPACASERSSVWPRSARLAIGGWCQCLNGTACSLCKFARKKDQERDVPLRLFFSNAFSDVLLFLSLIVVPLLYCGKWCSRRLRLKANDLHVRDDKRDRNSIVEQLFFPLRFYFSLASISLDVCDITRFLLESARGSNSILWLRYRRWKQKGNESVFPDLETCSGFILSVLATIAWWKKNMRKERNFSEIPVKSGKYEMQWCTRLQRRHSQVRIREISVMLIFKDPRG